MKDSLDVAITVLKDKNKKLEDHLTHVTVNNGKLKRMCRDRSAAVEARDIWKGKFDELHNRSKNTINQLAIKLRAATAERDALNYKYRALVGTTVPEAESL